MVGEAGRDAIEAPRGAIPSGTPCNTREAAALFVRHGSPRILLAALAIALVVRARLGALSPWDLAPVAVLVALWPLQEWAIHVFVLHWKPRRLAGRELDFAVPRAHRRHHREPWNPEILFIPIGSFVYSLPGLVALWVVATPSAALAWTGIAAHLVLALHYEWVHLLIHTRVQPRTRFYRRLWRNHRLHHFKNEKLWFGVTRLEADRWLGTAPEPDSVPPSPTARSVLEPQPRADDPRG